MKKRPILIFLLLGLLAFDSLGFAGRDLSLPLGGNPAVQPVGSRSVPLKDTEVPQPLPGARALVDKYSVFIEPCCSSVYSGPGNYDPTYEIGRDINPYTTGPLDLPRNGHRVVKYLDYIYQAPKVLGERHQIAARIGYQISPRSLEENMDAYHHRRLKKALNLEPQVSIFRIATEVGEGSQSHVFMIHDPVPDSKELDKLYPDAMARQNFLDPDGLGLEDWRRLLWASSHAKEVIKVRTPTPWGETLEKSVAQARRDIVLAQIFEKCANGFRAIENGVRVPVVEAVPYHHDPQEFQAGIFRQPAIHGLTAFNVAIKVALAQQGDPDAIRDLTEDLRFKSVEDAEHKIRLLEAFYKETHFDVIAFQRKNNLPPMAGWTRWSEDVMIVGFDYNLGQNVIWDPQAQVFKAVDF